MLLTREELDSLRSCVVCDNAVMNRMGFPQQASSFKTFCHFMNLKLEFEFEDGEGVEIPFCGACFFKILKLHENYEKLRKLRELISQSVDAMVVEMVNVSGAATVPSLVLSEREARKRKKDYSVIKGIREAALKNLSPSLVLTRCGPSSSSKGRGPRFGEAMKDSNDQPTSSAAIKKAAEEPSSKSRKKKRMDSEEEEMDTASTSVWKVKSVSPAANESDWSQVKGKRGRPRSKSVPTTSRVPAPRRSSTPVIDVPATPQTLPKKIRWIDEEGPRRPKNQVDTAPVVKARSKSQSRLDKKAKPSVDVSPPPETSRRLRSQSVPSTMRSRQPLVPPGIIKRAQEITDQKQPPTKINQRNEKERIRNGRDNEIPKSSNSAKSNPPGRPPKRQSGLELRMHLLAAAAIISTGSTGQGQTPSDVALKTSSSKKSTRVTPGDKDKSGGASVNQQIEKSLAEGDKESQEPCTSEETPSGSSNASNEIQREAEEPSTPKKNQKNCDTVENRWSPICLRRATEYVAPLNLGLDDEDRGSDTTLESVESLKKACNSDGDALRTPTVVQQLGSTTTDLATFPLEHFQVGRNHYNYEGFLFTCVGPNWFQCTLCAMKVKTFVKLKQHFEAEHSIKKGASSEVESKTAGQKLQVASRSSVVADSSSSTKVESLQRARPQHKDPSGANVQTDKGHVKRHPNAPTSVAPSPPSEENNSMETGFDDSDAFENRSPSPEIHSDHDIAFPAYKAGGGVQTLSSPPPASPARGVEKDVKPLFVGPQAQTYRDRFTGTEAATKTGQTRSTAGSASEKIHRLPVLITRGSSIYHRYRYGGIHFDEIQKGFACNVCSFESPTTVTMKAHIKKSHWALALVPQKSSDNSVHRLGRFEMIGKEHKCPYCPQQSSDFDMINDHVKVLHKDGKVLYKETGPNKYLVFDKYIVYRKGKVFKCALCDFSHLRFIRVRSHLLKHADQQVPRNDIMSKGSQSHATRELSTKVKVSTNEKERPGEGPGNKVSKGGFPDVVAKTRKGEFIYGGIPFKQLAKSDTFTCDECGMKVEQCPGIITHITECHLGEDGKLMVKAGQMKFLYAEKYWVTKDGSSFKCVACQYVAPDFLTVTGHVKKHADDDRVAAKRFVPLNNQDLLKKTVGPTKSEVDGMKFTRIGSEFECGICDYSSHYLEEMYGHLRLEHYEEHNSLFKKVAEDKFEHTSGFIVSKLDELYKCSLCDFKNKELWAFKAHFKAEHEDGSK